MTLRFDFLTMLDEIEAALKMPPKNGYTKRGVELVVHDSCEAGGESVVCWEIEQADIDMLRAALRSEAVAIATPSTPTGRVKVMRIRVDESGSELILRESQKDDLWAYVEDWIGKIEIRFTEMDEAEVAALPDFNGF